MDQRTRMLLEAPIGKTLLKLAAPNIVVMLAQMKVFRAASACLRLAQPSLWSFTRPMACMTKLKQA